MTFSKEKVVEKVKWLCRKSPRALGGPRTGARPRFAGAALLLVILLGGIGTACREDPQVEGQKRYERAQELVEKGELQTAAIEFRRALQYLPEFAAAHHELGSVYIKLQNFRGAFQEFSLAAKANPQDRESRLMVAELLVLGREFVRARERLNVFLETWPDDAEALVLLAECARGHQKLREAAELIEQALGIDPQNVRAHLNRAILRIERKDWAGAQKSLRVAWDFDSANMAAPLLLVDLLASRNRTRQTEAAVQEFLTQHGENPRALYSLAVIYLRHEKSEKAEQFLKRARTLGEDNPLYRGLLAQFYVASGKKNLAEAEFQEILSRYPEDSLNRLGQAEFYWREQRLEEARQAVDAVLQKLPNDWRALLLRGRIRLDQGDADNAILDLLQARKLNSDPAEVHYRLGLAFLRKNNVERAEGSLREALARDSEYPPARLLLAEMEIRSGRVDSGLSNLERLTSHSAKSARPRLLRSQAYFFKGEYGRAEGELQGLLDEMTDHAAERPYALRALGWVKLRRGRFAEARRLAKEALSLNPSSREALYLLGLCYLAEKQPERGLEVMESYAKKFQDQAAAFSALGELALLAKRHDVAEQHLKRAIGLNPSASTTRVSLAENYLAQNRFDLAKQTYEELVERDEGNAFAYLRLAQLEENLGEWEQARSLYKTSIRLSPENPIAKNNLAWLQVEHGGNVDVALGLAQQARELAPDDPRISDTLGWIYFKKGAYRTAIDYLGQSLEKIPENPVYHYHLGVAYHGAGLAQEAEESLKQALSLQPEFPGNEHARQLLAELASNQ